MLLCVLKVAIVLHLLGGMHAIIPDNKLNFQRLLADSSTPSEKYGGCVSFFYPNATYKDPVRTLQCADKGQVITQFHFVSYGNMTILSPSNSFKINGGKASGVPYPGCSLPTTLVHPICHSNKSREVLEELCLNRRFCTLPKLSSDIPRLASGLNMNNCSGVTDNKYVLTVIFTCGYGVKSYVSEFPCNNATHGIASDMSCKLRPSLTITSPDLNNGQNLCDDVVVNLTTLANKHYSASFSNLAMVAASFNSSLTTSAPICIYPRIPPTLPITTGKYATQLNYSIDFYSGGVKSFYDNVSSDFLGVPPNSFYIGVMLFNCSTIEATTNLSKFCAFSVRVTDKSPPVMSFIRLAVNSTSNSNTVSFGKSEFAASSKCSDNDRYGSGFAYLLQNPRNVSDEFLDPLTIFEARNPQGLSLNCTYNDTSFVVYPNDLPDIKNEIFNQYRMMTPFNYTFDVNFSRPVSVSINCTASDASDNAATGTMYVDFNDVVAPVVTVKNKILSFVANGNFYLYDFRLNVAGAFDAINGNVSGTINCTACTLTVCTPATENFALGKTTITCYANDKSLNIGSENFSITVTDNEDPIVVCSNVTIMASTLPDLNYTIISWNFTATDNSGSVNITYFYDKNTAEILNSTNTTAYGKFFYWISGKYNIKLVATDPSNNTNSCNFSVLVIDNQRPKIVCPDNGFRININTTSDEAYTALVMLPTLNVTDNVRLVESGYQCKATLNSYPIGTHDLKWYATDNSIDEYSVCKVTLVVKRNNAPIFSNCNASLEIKCNTSATDRLSSIDSCVLPNLFASDLIFGNITSYNTTANAVSHERINQSSNIGFLFCEPFSDIRGLTGSFEPTNIKEFNFGTTIVNYSVSTPSGITSVCSYNVTVNDPFPPNFFKCPPSVSQNKIVEADFSIYNANDNVDGSNLTYKFYVYHSTSNDNYVNTSVINASVSKAILSVGLYFVVIEAIDKSGNVGICSYNLTVISTPAATGSSSSIQETIAGTASAGFLVLILVVYIVIKNKRNAKKLLMAKSAYAELVAMSDEYILKRARDIQITLMAQKHAKPPAFEAFKISPKSKFEAPPSTCAELIIYITNTLNKGILRSDLELGSEIGQGEFGSVLEATLKTAALNGPSAVVAVKQLKTANSEENRVRFLKEAAIQAQFDHSNIVQLIGVCVIPVDAPTLIVLEYMHLGSLHSYLQSSIIKENLESLTLVRMAIDVCAGMVYLSESGFVHRDLAARNVLIDKEMTCRIGDFGLSIDMATVEESDGGIYSGTEGARIPIRWTALEAVLYRQFSTASDVWSFGVLLWEIWTYAEMPYEGWNNKKVTHQVQAGYRLPKPPGCPSDIYTCMLECWNKDARQRIPFNRLSVTLIECWKDINNSGGESGFHSDNRQDSDPIDLEALGGSGIYDNDNSIEIDRKSSTRSSTAYALAEKDDYKNQASEGTLYDIGGDGSARMILSKPTSYFPMSSGNSVARKASSLPRTSVLSAEYIMETGFNSNSVGVFVDVDEYGPGILKFYGPHKITTLTCCGIELFAPKNGTDGVFDGIRYFDCEKGCGVLVSEADVVQMSSKRSEKFVELRKKIMLRVDSNRSHSSVDMLVVTETALAYDVLISSQLPKAIDSRKGYLNVDVTDE